MKTNYQKHINILLIIWAVTIVGFFNRASLADPNTNCLVKLEEESQKITHLTESVYWPDFDFKNAKQYIAEPNAKQKSDFVRMVSLIIEPNYLPQELDKKTIFLKGWRGEANENFILQYEKPPYLIRIKNQTTTIIASRKWTSYWLSIVIQSKDKSKCVNKTDPNSIFEFTDQFLSKKLNSKAQDYTDVINSNGYVFKQIDKDYFLSYLVQSSHPNIDSVSIWTDGCTVIINLKERRKVIID